MLKNLRLSLAIVAIGFTGAGCALIVAGAGTGAGVYTYIKGELIRSYPATFQQTNKACLNTLSALKIPIKQQTAGSVEHHITGTLNDGMPVAIRITMIAPKITEVGVRSGIFGLWDKKVSELIHADLARRLQ
jgi:hypothetical protein